MFWSFINDSRKTLWTNIFHHHNDIECIFKRWKMKKILKSTTATWIVEMTLLILKRTCYEWSKGRKILLKTKQSTTYMHASVHIRLYSTSVYSWMSVFQFICNLPSSPIAICALEFQIKFGKALNFEFSFPYEWMRFFSFECENPLGGMYHISQRKLLISMDFRL